MVDGGADWSSEDAAFLRELQMLRNEVDALLGEDIMDERVTEVDLEQEIQELRMRLDLLETFQRQGIIRKAAHFGADVLVARGRAPLGWDGESRATFEEELSKYLDAELKVLNQDEANALALSWMELAPSEA